MNHIRKTLILFILSSFMFVGCNDLLKVDSDKLVFDEEYQMHSTNDSLYSMFGVFSKLQKLADGYVLFGELRGDLLDVSKSSDNYLREISNFEISANNPYLKSVKDYYAVINNCNYIIQYTDTAAVKNATKVNYRVYAAAKAIRAWTYMQLALNYGSVVYYEKPLLTVEEAQKSYPTLDMQALAAELIKDIKPWQDVETPILGSLDAHNISESFFPIRFILGDLYLWTQQYENAAIAYHDLMYRERFTTNSQYLCSRKVVNNAFTGEITINWDNIFSSSSEPISSIAASNEYSHNFDLDSLNLHHMFKASAVAVNNWNSQKYFHVDTVFTDGDLRINGSYSPMVYSYNGKFYFSVDSILVKTKMMNLNINKKVTPYRISLLYLRYAEAVNRLGKPNLAMAVLKNGLNSITMGNRKVIPQWENPKPTPNYMDFSDTRFASNFGIRKYGLGNVNLDTTYFIIPKLANLTDSINDVEDKIVNELALETAFEGNRFHDLMRVAYRRNDFSYLAKKVAAKHTSNKAAIEAKLMIPANWYLKKQ